MNISRYKTICMRQEKWTRSLFKAFILLFASAMVSPYLLPAQQPMGSRILQEKLYVHTDKNFYLAGEIVWFKVYYVDGDFHRPLDLSKIAYVEILDKTNKPLMQAKIHLEKGSGNGSFYLPSSVNSGNYKFRAYTNWMKNFDADLFFEKNITLVNSLKPLGTKPAPVALKYDIQFMPEGGNLVNGLESRVAFKLTDQFGKGHDFKGLLVNSNNDTISAFESMKFGMGSFLLKPEKGNAYKAILKLSSGEELNSGLPAAIDNGYVMQLTDNGSSLSLNLHCNTGSSDLSVIANTRGSVKLSEKIRLTNGSATLNIDKNKLGEGISTITVLDGGKPVCERLFFRQPKAVLPLTASSDAKQYDARSKVSLAIQAKTPLPANLSLAVYRLDSLQTLDQENILTYFWLGSDLKGKIESPGYYFSGSSKEILDAADNLMLTQGWRRYSYTASRPPSLNYAPEFDGHIVTGRITNTITQNPLDYVKTYLSVPGVQVQFHTSLSDEEGRIHFDLRDFYGESEIVVQTEMLKDSNYRIDITNPFSEKYSSRAVPAFSIDESVQRSLRTGSINMQTVNAFTSDSLRRFDLPLIDSTPFFGKSARRYFLDDYVRFNTVEEVLREYVPEVGLHRAEGQLKLRVSDWNQMKYLEGEPLILLDGIPVSHRQILAYDPLKIRKLEVVTNRYIKGKFVFDGIVSFTSYHGNMEDLRLDSKTIILDYEGMQMEREFYSPKYLTEQQRSSRLPDFRTLLQWTPDIRTDRSGNAQLEFYTSDIKGNYIAVIQGIDEGGNAGSYYLNFEVKGK
jgi:hypothetical protein